MSVVPQTSYITEDEYRAGEEVSHVKHEWFQGQVYVMAGGSRNYSRLCGNVHTASDNALRDKTCEAYNSEMRIKVEATGLETYPDTVICCPESRFVGIGNSMLLTPTVIFEVLSPSTEKYDRTRKFEQYKQIPTQMDYVLVDQHYICVEHFHWGEDVWLYRSYIHRSDVLRLQSVDIELPLDEIYRTLNLPEALLGLGTITEESDDPSRYF